MIVPLVSMQVRATLRRPRAILSLVAITPLLWIHLSRWIPADRATEELVRWALALTAFSIGGAARGAAAAGDTGTSRMPLPTLPLTPRTRMMGAIATALVFVVPALVGMLCFERMLPHRERSLAEGVIQLVRLVLVITPLIGLGVGAVTMPAVGWGFGIGMIGVIVAGPVLGVLDTLPGALVWGVGGTALVVTFANRIGAGAHPGVGRAAAAAFAPRRTVGAPGGSPARAWWALQARQRVWFGIVGGAPLLLLAFAVARMRTPLDALAFGVGSVTIMLTMTVPIAPLGGGSRAGPAGVVEVLRRLPIAPRTLYLHALLAVVPIVLAGTAPLALTLLALGAFAPELVGPVSLADAARVVGPTAVAALAGGLLFRAGSHLGLLVESRVRRLVPLLLAALVIPGHVWLSLPPPFPEPYVDPWQGAAGMLVLALACVVWTGGAVGRRR